MRCQVLCCLVLLSSIVFVQQTSVAIAAEQKTVRDFGAVGDGKADDTAALQKAVDAGLGAVRFTKGVYRITQPVVVDLDKVGFTSILGDGTARIVMAGPGPALRLVGTHGGSADPRTVKPNVWARQRMPLVDGLEIVGNHEQAVAIEALGTMQLTITRVNIRECLHGIHLVRRNRNIIISNCHVYKNRGIGIYLDELNLHQINITGTHVSYNAGGGIVVRGGDVRNIHIAGCDIEGNMFKDGPETANVLIDSRGSTGAGVAEVAITGCTIQHTRTGPESANIRVIGPDAHDRTWGHVTIASNVLSDTQYNIDLLKARGVTIVGNTVWTGLKYSLRVRDCSNVIIGVNNFDRNPGYYREEDKSTNAMLLQGCCDSTINGLHINGVREAPAGLVMENCRRCNVTGCTILDCDNTGLLLKDVTNCRVSNCLIDRADTKDGNSKDLDWKPLLVEGGGRNVIDDNITSGQRTP